MVLEIGGYAVDEGLVFLLVLKRIGDFFDGGVQVFEYAVDESLVLVYKVLDIEGDAVDESLVLE